MECEAEPPPGVGRLNPHCASGESQPAEITFGRCGRWASASCRLHSLGPMVLTSRRSGIKPRERLGPNILSGRTEPTKPLMLSSRWSEPCRQCEWRGVLRPPRARVEDFGSRLEAADRCRRGRAGQLHLRRGRERRPGVPWQRGEVSRSLETRGRLGAVVEMCHCSVRSRPLRHTETLTNVPTPKCPALRSPDQLLQTKGRGFLE